MGFYIIIALSAIMSTVNTNTWRLIDTDIAPPAYTFAVDEAIIHARATGIVPNTLHLYRRNPPAVSIGYFQSAYEDVNISACTHLGIKIIRRISGGGAIYTDDKQLEYSVALKGLECINNDVIGSYRYISKPVVTTLNKFGLRASYKPVNDIIVNGKKISGCAQTRRSGVVLQHGTILVDINIDVMEKVLKPPTMKNMNSPRSHKLPITTMRAELGTLPDMKEVKSKLIDSFETEFNIKVVSGTLTDYEQALINKLIREKYENDAWNYKR